MKHSANRIKMKLDGGTVGEKVDECVPQVWV